jgi:hypothetical protein
MTVVNKLIDTQEAVVNHFSSAGQHIAGQVASPAAVDSGSKLCKWTAEVLPP